MTCTATPVDGGSETVTSVGRPVLGPLEADDTSIFHNDRVTLTWREENVRNVRLNGRPVSGGSETLTPPDGETLYVLTADDLHGTAVDGGSVTVTSVGRPVLAISVNPTPIASGRSTTLTWTALNVMGPSIDKRRGDRSRWAPASPRMWSRTRRRRTRSRR